MDKKISIDLLNRAVAGELSAVHQYMYFHFHCEDAGYELLAKLFYKTAIKEMMHVEMLAERILFLDGDVDMEVSQKTEKIRDIAKMLEKARQMEQDTVNDYNQWSIECAKNNDSASKQLFDDLVKIEEEHYDEYDIQLSNMEKFGNEYLALQSIEHSKKNVGE